MLEGVLKISEVPVGKAKLRSNSKECQDERLQEAKFPSNKSPEKLYSFEFGSIEWK